MPKQYKNEAIYSCIVLNRLAMALNINLYQSNLDSAYQEAIERGPDLVSKADIIHEIRSNYNMANKILNKLEQDGHVRMERSDDGKSFNIFITKDGLVHIRKCNEFYLNLYETQIKDHYMYVGIPAWIRDIPKSK